MYFYTLAITGIVLAALYVIFTPWIALDFNVFLEAANGANDGFFYGHWLLIGIAPLAALPYKLSWLIWIAANTVGIAYAIRVFKGSYGLAFTSYAFFTLVIYGQIDGIIIGTLALSAFLLERNKVYLAGFTLFLTIAKWHVGLPLGFGVLYFFADDWHKRIDVVKIVICLVLVYTAFNPTWWLDILFCAGTPHDDYGLSTWRVFGAWSLVLWVPMLKVRTWRLFVVTWALTAPYLQGHSMLALAVLPLGWSGLALYLPYFASIEYGWLAMIAPVSVYCIEIVTISKVNTLWRI